jgi:predicted dehydrogenase
MQVHSVAFIGARGHTHYPLRGLERLPHLRVTALADVGAGCSVDPIARWCAEHGHVAQRFDDWRNMLDTAKPHLLVVCGPFELHAEMTLAAIEREIHVFAEKPVAMTLEELDRLRDAHARHPHVHLAGMMGKRYDPGFYTARALVRSGAIGDVRLINARKSYKLGKRDAHYHDRATYGGTIPWVGAHAFDWIAWIGGHPIEQITALHSSQHSAGNGTMERSAGCLMALAGERIATASIDVFRPPTAPTHGDDWVRVVGTEGVIEARESSVQLINAGNDGSTPVPVGNDGRQIFTDLVKAIELDNPGDAHATMPALVDAKQTFELTRTCLLARQSADENRTLRV